MQTSSDNKGSGMRIQFTEAVPAVHPHPLTTSQVLISTIPNKINYLNFKCGLETPEKATLHM